MTFTIDLDLPKLILRCAYVSSVRWRVSASGKGFHLQWECKRSKFCYECHAHERYFDDLSRQKRDAKRAQRNRRVLWDSKGKRRAGRWHVILK